MTYSQIAALKRAENEALQKLNTAATNKQKESGFRISYATAYAAAMKENPELYVRYLAAKDEAVRAGVLLLRED